MGNISGKYNYYVVTAERIENGCLKNDIIGFEKYIPTEKILRNKYISKLNNHNKKVGKWSILSAKGIHKYTLEGRNIECVEKKTGTTICGLYQDVDGAFVYRTKN